MRGSPGSLTVARSSRSRVVARPAILLTVMASIPWGMCCDDHTDDPTPRHDRGQVPVAKDLAVKPLEVLTVDKDGQLGDDSDVDDGTTGVEPVSRLNRRAETVCRRQQILAGRQGTRLLSRTGLLQPVVSTIVYLVIFQTEGVFTDYRLRTESIRSYG